jgi:hypothetical protein
MAINSAQGIAALYRGNPEQLQQRIQKEQQAKPGLPPDLQEMLALQIVTNEEDGVAAQKAMDQLKQLSGGQGGKPPTVMASLQQQAAQKLQAQAVQAQQKQQGIQSLMQQAPAAGVPENTPEPEMQPEAQGIDQLPAEFEMAEGGIVAFESGGAVDAAKEEAQAAIARLQSYGLAQRKDDPEGFETAQAQAAAARARLQAAQAAYAQEMSAAGMDRPVQVSGLPKARPQQAAPQDADNQSAAETARLQRQKSLPQASAPAPVKDLKALAAQRAPAPAPAAAQPTAPAPMASAVAPEGSTQAAYDKYMKTALTKDRDTERAAEEARFAAVGKQDTSQIDRMIAELEKRKQELAPKQGYEGLMEYLSQISANSQPGRGSFASGAAGARGVSALNKERQTQQFELTKQGVELAQKKLDSDRAFSLDKYKAGQEGAKRVDDAAKDAAKEFGLDSRNEKDLANRIKTQLLANQGSLAAASVRAEGNEGKRQVEVLKAELASIDKELAPLLKTPFGPNKAKIAILEAKKEQLAKDLRAAGGVSTMAPAPGAPSLGGTNQQSWSIKPL